MLGDDLIILELFAGAGCVTEATKVYASTINKNIRALLIDFVDCEEAVTRHERLRVLLLDENVHYFQMDLSQLERSDIPQLLHHFIGCTLENVDVMHVSIDCSTFSNAARAIKIHRTMDGAAVSAEAVGASKTLRTMFKLAYWLTEVNPLCLITFESPARGSFRSQPEVQQALRLPNWWLLSGDYCANASEQYDGIVEGSTRNRKGGLWPQKPTVMLVHGIDWNFQLKSCAGKDCRMVIPGTKKHALVVCNNDGMIRGQKTINDWQKAYIPLGLYIDVLHAHNDWIQGKDGYSAWCLKCGDGGSGLIMCDNSHCHRVQHSTCKGIYSSDEDPWFCDVCAIEKELQSKQ